MEARGLGIFKAKAMAAAQPLNAMLELTYRCNWRCVFCYNPRHVDLRGLTGAEWLEVLDDLRALGTLWVALTGGEAMTHPDFLGIARGVKARRMALRVLTNGSLVDDAMARELASLAPTAVELSLHGATAEVHDAATARPGSFDAMWAGIERLKHLGVPLLLKTPLTRLNEHQLDEMVALAGRHGLSYRLDPTITPRDDGDSGPLAFAPSRAGVERLMAHLQEAGELPMANRREGEANCGLGRITMAVDPEGEVFPCIQWRHTSLGNVRTTRLRDLWHASRERSEAAEVSRRANDEMARLGGAVASFPFCPAIAYSMTGNPLKPADGHLELAAAAASARTPAA